MTVLFGLLALAPAAEGGIQAPTPRERFEELLKTHDAPRNQYISGKLRDRAKPVSEQFLELAREHPDDPASIDALGWVVTHIIFTTEAGKALELLARDHSKSDKLAPICRELDQLYGGDFKPLEAMLRNVYRDSPHRETRAWACFALARRLKHMKENAERDTVQHDAFAKGANVPFVPKPTMNAGDLEKLSREAAGLFEEVSDKYGDVKARGAETLGDAARRELSELLSLAIGQIAPEIEGKDVDGRRFRLSDYRGKVVVLNFFSHRACPICRALYPEDRTLVKRFEGKPFVMLGISCEDKLDELRSLKDQGQITWRTWFDGPVDGGPIAGRWNIRGWPMVYILDDKGVIRNKGFLQGVVVDRAVDQLVKEIDQKPNDLRRSGDRE